MLDIDDLAQLALSDRSGWLDRAAQLDTRWRTAVAQGKAHADERAQDLAAPRDVVWLVLPPALQGIGLLVQDLRMARTPPVLLWQPALATLPLEGTWLSLGDDTTRPGLQIALDPLIDTQAHPARICLALLALLDRWLGGDVAEAAIALSAANRAALEQCVPAVPRQENPAKRLAHVLNERLPVFWAPPPLAGAALDWRQRLILYAETRAEWASAPGIRAIEAMVRFPHYWPQAGTFVRLGTADQSTADASAAWLPALARLWQSRRVHALDVAPPAADAPPATALYFLELGEWVALYAAALLGLDPVQRTALDFLDALSENVGRA